jgi:hypothetical protein
LRGTTESAQVRATTLADLRAPFVTLIAYFRIVLQFTAAQVCCSLLVSN